ncbi:aa3-type cytochrome oxidase subunit CtaJ [Mycolicibacter minnesotensis]
MEILGVFIGIPVAMFALLAARTLSRKGPRAATYSMTDRWTHPSILWSATDEVIGGGHGHGTSEFSVGGGVSGNW